MSCDAVFFLGCFGVALSVVAVIATIADRRHRRRR